MDTHSVFTILPDFLHLFFLVADVSAVTLLCILLGLFLLLSFALAGAEVAIFSLNNKDVNMLKTKQHPAARRIIDILEEPKEVFASLLIAGIFINICIIVISNFLITEFVPFGNMSRVLVLLIKVVAISFVLVFFGEIFPKYWATQNNLRFAYGSAVIVEAVHLLLRRLSKWVVSLADRIGQRFGTNNAEANSIQELDAAIDIQDDDEASPEEKNIMKGIVKFGTISVKQIMRSRLEVNGVDYNSSFTELIQKVQHLHYSRLPVYRGSMDDVAGIITTKDLVAHLNEGNDFDWHSLMRVPYFVPESKLISDLLRDFQTRRTHFAVVVDEFGGTSGIVTMEDIIEEVIGEIRDEFDDEEINMRKIDDSTFVFEARTMLHDMCKLMQLPADIFDKVKGDSESVGGLVLELAGEFPKVDDTVETGDFQFKVLEAEKNRLKMVEVKILNRNA
ncbi:MAG: gliding motility-associated protein GldE [Chitinophagaceae bacterium]|nr:gliding motility-associated protein GldE [Chitinophagaceae bacterium]